MKLLRQLGLLWLLIILIMVGIGHSACNKTLNSEPDLTGLITEINLTDKNEISGQILVESETEGFVDKYMVTIKDETRLFEQVGDELHQIPFEVLDTQQQVQIWFSGPVMESFPMQVTAQQVVIIAYHEPSHLQLAEHWAPIWWQDTDVDDYRADYLTIKVNVG